mgnify:CR=1 FL=1
MQRAVDFMLRVLNNSNERVGCLGVRLLEDRVNFYNLIIGERENTSKGYMSCAFHLACNVANSRFYGCPIMVSVLRKNPAMAWYLQRGFVVTDEHEDYVELTRINKIKDVNK